MSGLAKAPGFESAQRTIQRSNSVRDSASARLRNNATKAGVADEPMACPRCRVRYVVGSECPDCRVELVGESYIDAAPPRSTRPILFDWLFSHLTTVVIVAAGALVVPAVIFQMISTAWKVQGL